MSLSADLAYYVAYPAQTPQRPKVRAFRDWLFEEVTRATWDPKKQQRHTS